MVQKWSSLVCVCVSVCTRLRGISVKVFKTVRFISLLSNNQNDIFIQSFIFSNGCILVRITVNPEPIPGTLGTRWEYTRGTMDTHILHTYSHLQGQHRWCAHSVFLDSGIKLKNTEETCVDIHYRSGSLRGL